MPKEETVRKTVIWLLLVGWGWADVLGVDEAVRYALAHNPDVKMAGYTQKEREEVYEAVRGQMRPRLDLQGIGGVGESKLQERKREDFSILEGSLHATQLLYDFGRTRSRIDAADADAAIARARLKETLLETVYRVKSAYYRLLRATGRVAVYREQVALQKAQLARAEKFYRAGIRSIIDVTDAKANLAAARRNLAAAGHDVVDAKADLEAVMGGWPDGGTFPTVASRPIVERVVGIDPPVCSVASLWPELLRLRGRFAAAEAAVRGAKHRYESLGGLYYPTFTFQVDGTVRHLDESLRPLKPQEEAKAGVIMAWNLYRGGQDSHRIQAAQIAWLKRRSALNREKIALKKELTHACTNLMAAYDDLHLGLAVFEANRRKLHEATRRYENDLDDYIALQNAQFGYIKALDDLFDSFFRWLDAKVYLERVVGR